MARRRDAWRAYAAGSEVGHFADFCKTHLVQSEDRWEGKPLVLDPWQRRLFGEALAYGPDGLAVWRSVVIVAPRKNGKTAMLAALALYRLLTSAGRPEVLLAASPTGGTPPSSSSTARPAPSATEPTTTSARTPSG